MPPRYTELYEPVGVDYILFTYPSCTRLHNVLLRCPWLVTLTSLPTYEEDEEPETDEEEEQTDD